MYRCSYRLLDPVATGARLALACFCIFISFPVTSALPYQQSPIDQGDGYFSNASAGAQNADNFTFSSSVSLESITWWGSYDGADTDAFIVRILSDGGGTPGSILQDYTPSSVSVSPTSLLDVANAPVYRYDYNLPSAISLLPSTYYLSITNETLNFSWYWLVGSGGDTTIWSRGDDSDPWIQHGTADVAFALNGTVQTNSVPLPGTLVLFGIGLWSMRILDFLRRRHHARKGSFSLEVGILTPFSF